MNVIALHCVDVSERDRRCRSACCEAPSVAIEFHARGIWRMRLHGLFEVLLRYRFVWVAMRSGTWKRRGFGIGDNDAP